jgi:ech hydrogenase subunit A
MKWANVGPLMKERKSCKRGDPVRVVLFLMLFPLIAAGLLAIVRNGKVRAFIVRVSALLIASGSVLLAVQTMGKPLSMRIDSEWLSYGMLGLDLAMTALIIFFAISRKKPLAGLLTLIQTPILVWFELSDGHGIKIAADITIDRLAVIMALIIGVVGSLICVYSIAYMKEYHRRHKEYKDRTSFFLAMLFVFLSAMFGIVFSNNLIWMYFFWEVTTLCSFLLIGYTGTKEAVDNAFRALVMNLAGGIGFAAAVVYVGTNLHTVELSALIEMGLRGTIVVVPALLLSFAGLTKAAQMPFSSWLLGAMVAPTPSSALLHSSTMVKAGVFLIIRLAPVLMGNIAGLMVAMVGGITFLLASLAAISQTDAKRLLAWSTIANLGLIVACGGIGTYEAVWAGILLIIFHAVSKSLLFLSVGTVEHNIGSRDIEDMHGMVTKLPEMAVMLTIGIAGMFLAPFGMLISKWAALRAFIDSDNVLIVMALVFGSAATLFYWTKWLGKIVAVLGRSERIENRIKKDEWVSLGIHAIMTVGLCFVFPVISNRVIEPYLEGFYGTQIQSVLSSGNTNLMLMMLGMVLLMPIAMYVYVHLKDDKLVSSYMAGVNRGDNRAFTDSFGKPKEMYLANWYLSKYLDEKALSLFGVAASATTLAVVLMMALGGVL